MRYRYLNFDCSDIVMARNFLANYFLQDKNCSHILFVDSDMAIPQDTLATLFDSDKDFIGAIYPERRLDLEKYGAYVRKVHAYQAALALSLKYNVTHLTNDVAVVNGLCRVNAPGFGSVLIARSVFEKLIASNGVDKLVSARLRDAGLDGDVFDFFGEIMLKSGDYLSEDYSFCERVNRHKVCEIWAAASGIVGHVGQFSYGAPYVDNLKARSAPVSKPKAE